jgi:hypothetical protein
MGLFMKLKYYGFLISILTIVYVIIMALSSKGRSITKLSISRIGAFQGNYAFFFIGTTILILLFTLFLYKSYVLLGLKPKLILYFIPLICIIGLTFKAGEVFDSTRLIHNILFIISGLLAIYIMVDLNKKYIDHTNKMKKTLNVLPKIALIGTIAIFVLIGLNLITEMIYMGAVISWINMISIST